MINRWTHAVSQLKTRAAKVRRRSAEATDQSSILEESLDLCDSLLRELAGAKLECEAWARRCEAQTALRISAFEQMPIACVETDDEGLILRANRLGALLLNVSSKHLQNRLLMHFTQDRAAFATLLRTTREQNAQRTALILRPRDRPPLRVEATIVRGASDEGTTWFLAPIESFRAVATSAEAGSSLG